MPYQGEFASYEPLRRLAESERVNKLLSKFVVRTADSVQEEAELKIESYSQLKKTSQWQPSWALAIDGSHHEVKLENGFPGAEASYLTVASVLIDVKRMRILDEQRPVAPQEFNSLEQTESIDCVLPGANVIYKGEISSKSSLRHTLFSILNETSLDSDIETLKDTYEVLLSYKPHTRAQQCPYEDCPTDGDYPPRSGDYTCTCKLQRKWYSTDALRVHERMAPAGTNGAVFSEIMQVLERVWLIHILRIFEQRSWLSVLSQVAIVVDGPLAVFGQPAWLSQSIYSEIKRINENVKRATGKDMLLIGVEKTGIFVNHFEQLDLSPDSSNNSFNGGHVALPSDEYIKKHVIFSESEKPYGHATYFGRKIMYKTKGGSRIVASLPFLDEAHRDLDNTNISQYPRLVDALTVLEELSSSRFQNSLMPLISAHSEASIPLHLGNKVLANIAREIIKNNNL